MSRLALVLFALAACGDDDSSRRLPDAPVVPDASADAATSGVVSLTVTYEDAPVADVDVYFQNADSSLVAMVPTGADGVASATMEPGGYVVAVDPFPALRKGVPISNGDLRVFAGVKPGDQLRLTDGIGSSAPPVTVTVNAPIDPDANQYTLFTSCGGYFTMTGPNGSGSVPTTQVTLYGCGSTADVLVMTTHVDGVTRSHVYQADVPLVDQGTIELTGAYTTTPDVTYSFANIPAGFTDLTLRTSLATPRGHLLDDYLGGIAVAEGAATQVLARPTIAGAAVVSTADLSQGTLTRHSVVEWGAPSPTVTIEVGGALLPEYADPPSVDIATGRIVWSAEAAGAAPDFAYARIYAGRPSPSLGWSFEVVAPYTGAAIQLPTLQGDLAMFNFVADDTADIYDLTTAKVPGGYDAIRASALSVNFYSGAGIAVGASGRASLANLQQFVVRRLLGLPATVGRGAAITAR